MQGYIKRKIEPIIKNDLKHFPAVGILGPRQCGKSTLALQIEKNIKDFLYLDLELPSNYRMLEDPELFFNANKDKIICLDEIQIKSELFSILRGIIDKDRKRGRFILLGSSSPALIKNSSQSLAGRISFNYLTPFMLTEVSHLKAFDLNKFWLTGGLPESFLASTNKLSYRWRENFIKTFIERDIPQMNLKIPSIRLRRFLRLSAHFHGKILNSQKIGEALGVSYHTVRNYIEIFEESFIFRILEPLETNLKKRMIKSPKLYIRDSGI